MFDFTKKIELESNWKQKYQIVKFCIYFAFLTAIIYFSHLALFPSKYFFFFFKTPLASKNTIIEPRDYQDKLYKSGRIENGQLVFDTVLSHLDGNFSKVEISLLLDKNSAPIGNNNSISVRKAYRSFFYPEGEPIVKLEELKNNQEFPSGSLLSSGQSVYIVDEEEIRAIDSEITFQSLGFSWDDVISVNSEQLSNYKKGKLFTLASPHPSGTIFAGQESGKYYLIDKKQKRESIDPALVRFYLVKNPIMISENSLITESSCAFEKDFSFLNNWHSCELLIENMQKLPGNNYQYKLNLNSGVKIKEARIAFKKTVDKKNWKLALYNIKKNIILNYYGQP